MYPYIHTYCPAEGKVTGRDANVVCVCTPYFVVSYMYVMYVRTYISVSRIRTPYIHTYICMLDFEPARSLRLS